MYKDMTLGSTDLHLSNVSYTKYEMYNLHQFIKFFRVPFYLLEIEIPK